MLAKLRLCLRGCPLIIGDGQVVEHCGHAERRVSRVSCDVTESCPSLEPVIGADLSVRAEKYEVSVLL